jgi:hypothetical protein
MRFVFVSFLFLVDDFDLSVSSVTRNRAPTNSPFGLRETVPKQDTFCGSRAFTAMGLWSYYFWACAEGQRAAAQSRSQYLLNRSKSVSV